MVVGAGVAVIVITLLWADNSMTTDTTILKNQTCKEAVDKLKEGMVKLKEAKMIKNVSITCISPSMMGQEI